ncbi:MAG TPA: fibronectin type III domain-containing protein, partial [Bryobacteraceae bacterium]|nr:fibronectin type III domain-containing protein [Bryobacteraceae bacterium]
FPRIMNYMLTDPTNVSLINDYSSAEIERNLAAVDLITGTNGDSTLGAGAWVNRLRRINPKLQIIPYQQAFMTQYLDRLPVWSAADMTALFNQSVHQEWFMYDVRGQRIFSPDFPQNVQMNHSPHAPVIDGVDFNHQLAKYLQRGILPFGLWQGFHFDQPEWYPNPLLANKAGEFPQIDMNRDQRPDTQLELHDGWKAGFINFFRNVREQFGPDRLLFGNAGYIAQNPSMLPYLNGWLREILTPYDIAPNGDWKTDEASGWYQLQQAYQMSMRYVQAPAITGLEYTGAGLGTPNGKITANGYPDRVSALEPRDYRRVRLGLTSTLMDDGYFEYDLIDNTTVPLWFDEYSVDQFGVATRDLSGKGYMGAPLGDAVEIRTQERVVAMLDFESTPAQAGLFAGPSVIITSDPSQVIDGQYSAIFRNLDLAQPQFIASTHPGLLPLEEGKTYEATMEYRLLEYKPATYKGFLAFGIGLTDEPLQSGRSNFQFIPDVDGPGQQGKMRVVARIPRGKTGVLNAGFLDAGSVVVDNIKISEGGPGVWRRDFENAIALVNPTPNSIRVTQAQIQGPLNRSGVRRIRGAQAPNWNDGSTVSAGIDLPPGDGVILLADPLPSAPLSSPTSVVADRGINDLKVYWRGINGYPAGYLIRYGEDPVTPSQELMVTRHHTTAQLTGLQPGTRYYVRVAAVDYRGGVGASSTVLEASTQGTQPSRPEFSLSPASPAIAPGALVVLNGINLASGQAAVSTAASLPNTLAGTAVLVNGVPAPLVSVSPSQIVFQAPWILGGTFCFVHVLNSSTLSAERRIPLASAAPDLVVDDEGGLIAIHADNGAVVSESDPALPGEVITVRATGLGRVEPAPDVGGLPTPGSRPVTEEPAFVSIGGQAADEVSAQLMPDDVAAYVVTFTVPEGVTNGPLPLTIRAAGIPGPSLPLQVRSIAINFENAKHARRPKR